MHANMFIVEPGHCYKTIATLKRLCICFVGFLNLTLSVEVSTEGSAVLTCDFDSNALQGSTDLPQLLFTLCKDSVTLTSQRKSLVFNASNSMNPYGVYICTVEQSTKNTSLLLQESGKLLCMSFIFRNEVIIMTDLKYAVRFSIEISSEQGICQEWLVIHYLRLCIYYIK